MSTPTLTGITLDPDLQTIKDAVSTENPNVKTAAQQLLDAINSSEARLHIYQIQMSRNFKTLGDSIMATLADLQASIAAEDTVIAKAVTLINGFAAQLAALQPNQAAIDALKADVESQAAALGAAVAGATPGTGAPAQPTS